MEHISDILVMGSGLAGLGYALKVADFARVNLVTKRGLTETSTKMAQGGIAAVLGADDRFEYHIQDTLTTGEGLSHPDIVGLVVRQGPTHVRELIDMGAHFDLGQDNGYDLGREGGHSHRRIIHAHDMTGAEVERILVEKVLAHPNIQVFENHMGVNLITLERVVRQGRVVTEVERTCLGAYVLNKATGQVDSFMARITLLATGGVGKVYLYTSNPDIATGDGIAMAYRAGARIGDMEFMQFHPTCLYHPEAKNLPDHRSRPGEGSHPASSGRRDVHGEVPRVKDLAPRDMVARAIDPEMKKTGADCVYLDISHKPADFSEAAFPISMSSAGSSASTSPKSPSRWCPPPLHVRRGGDGRLGAHQYLQPLRGGGSVHDRSPRRQPPGQQLPAGGRWLFAPSLVRAPCRLLSDTGDPTEICCPNRRSRWRPGTLRGHGKRRIGGRLPQLGRNPALHVELRRHRPLRQACSSGHRRRIGHLINREIDEYYRNFIITRRSSGTAEHRLVAKLIVRLRPKAQESRGLHYNLDYPQADDQNFRQDSRDFHESWH